MTRSPGFVERRRSIRAFRAEAGRPRGCSTRSSRPRASRPRRITPDRGASSSIDTDDAKLALARGMGAQWRADLERRRRRRRAHRRARRGVARQDHGRARARARCLTWDGLDRYPDEARQRAEWGMALLSLGAAVENLMLSAADARPRVVLGRGADLLSRRPHATRCDCRPSGSPTRWCSSATPIPAYVGRQRPPVPLDELRLNLVAANR